MYVRMYELQIWSIYDSNQYYLVQPPKFKVMNLDTSNTRIV